LVLNADAAYTYIQDLFRRGLVVVVGSGASCAHGLPTMGQLADHLLVQVPQHAASLCDDGRAEWERVAEALENGVDLESAIGLDMLPESLASVLTSSVADQVRGSETQAISAILADTTTSAFGRLLRHSLQASEVIDVVTTNYDRLIEVHAARAGVRVDTMFYGHTVGRLDHTLSREELLKPHVPVGKSGTPQTRHRAHVRLSKPHGSLDWFSHHNEFYRCDLPITGAHQIVAPGGNKYRLGYEIPFDAQRARANRAIDAASALLFIGYGFNDDHLQTHLIAKMPEVPTVVVSKTLTDSALRHLKLNPSAIGIEDNGKGGSRLTQGTGDFCEDSPLWRLDTLVKEVLDL